MRRVRACGWTCAGSRTLRVNNSRKLRKSSALPRSLFWWVLLSKLYKLLEQLRRAAALLDDRFECLDFRTT